MTPDHSDKISLKVEALCKQGCSEVNQLLEQAEKGRKIEALAEFSNAEISQITDELSKIMAVYEIDKDVDKEK